MDYAQAGKRIRESRKLKGWSQAQLADKTGISTMSIRRYENADRHATFDTYCSIADTLGVDPNWLMHGRTLEEKETELKDRVKKRGEQARAMSVYLDGLTPDEIKAVDTIVHSLRKKKEE